MAANPTPGTIGDLPRRKPEPLLPRDILGNAEVRKLAGGITRHTLIRWREREGFPKPIRSLESGELWDRRHVQAWLRENR